ncbi:hypothetical protein KMZ68_01155 [Bradyrhizobium sediminis]|uniref:Uncharacterized protein n=1 Tax=Bradyrhizobium sediminis TaxID=2840469 RepID=A0A975RT92_9BRAD|nr:hypothetical protein [Bradyrhizobium sediminis]QWG18541.1 hypothetical protein KMZ68_01155 [Bradyrhizobium sediminis]
MGDNLVPNEVVEVCSLPLQVSQIVAHEADEPNAIVDLLEAEFPVETLILLQGRQSRPWAAARTSAMMPAD